MSVPHPLPQPPAQPRALQALPRRRSEVLLPLYRRLAADMGIRPLAAQAVEVETAETLAPHPRLRQQLQDDAAMAALLPGASGRFALGAESDLPFSVLPSGLILLPPVLTDDAAALAAAARWGLEAAHEVEQGPPDVARLVRLLRHGAGLLDALAPAARDLLLQLLPPSIGAELWGGRAAAPSAGLLAWMAARVGDAGRELASGAAADAGADMPTAEEAGGLERPVESLLVAGGDSRLRLDPHSGQNRYGVPPRPRPEAVHFSSSTASAVSDYGFLFCDLLRRDLLTALHADGIPAAELRRRAADATGRAITRLLGLADADCEAAIAASGTDTELLAVLVARAGAEGRPVLNLLVSPEESGRGVRLAGSGRYFDEIAATGASVVAGAAAFADGPVAVEEVAIRDAAGRPRSPAEVDAEFLATGRAALERGCHVLAHALLASKTGLSAPSRAAIDALVALAPQRVDVVIDACQMRTPFADLGQLVRAGWMLQVSGSKFLTGPPFSGALVVPAALRGRAAAVGAGLLAAPGIGHPHDWTRASAARMPAPPGPPPSFGSVFRWLPALLEAELFASLPEDFRAAAFDRFRAALAPRLAASPWLQPIDTGDDGPAGDDAEALARLSILSFQVLGRRWDGRLAPLGDADCRRLFEALNRDVSPFLPGVGPAAAALARLQAHIGQPVTLGAPPGTVTVLRMVLGARFFSIVFYAGAGAAEAALQSEIADARRAIAKVELLAEHWWRLARALENP